MFMAPLTLSACKILPLSGEGAPTVAVFDAEGFAAGLWTDKALPHFDKSAVPLSTVIEAIATDFAAAGKAFGYRAATEGAPWSFVVKGRGKVTQKNTKSRAGTLSIDLEGSNQPTTFAIQIGPVVRGNAIRDALPFVSFKDFTNQLEYADVGKAFTAIAMRGVASGLERIIEGSTIEVVGALSLNSPSDKLVVTPVSLKVVA